MSECMKQNILAVKNPPAKLETQVQLLDWENPLEKEIMTHSRILAWEISWTEESVELQFIGLPKSLT